jgi:hypothetical protein
MWHTRTMPVRERSDVAYAGSAGRARFDVACARSAVGEQSMRHARAVPTESYPGSMRSQCRRSAIRCSMCAQCRRSAVRGGLRASDASYRGAIANTVGHCCEQCTAAQQSSYGWCGCHTCTSTWLCTADLQWPAFAAAELSLYGWLLVVSTT